MRNTKQRQLIFQALTDNPVHPTADYLYALLKPKHPALSLGTVYRNLNLLAQTGQIKRISGLDTKEHFDHNTFPHAHLYCSNCGQVGDILIPPTLAKNLDILKQSSGYIVDTCEINLKGLCKNCKNSTGDTKK